MGFITWYFAALGIFIIARALKQGNEKKLLKIKAKKAWEGNLSDRTDIQRHLKVVNKANANDRVDFFAEALLPLVLWGAGRLLLQTELLRLGKAVTAATWALLIIWGLLSTLQILTALVQTAELRSNDVEILSPGDSAQSNPGSEVYNFHQGPLAPVFRFMDFIYLGKKNTRFEVAMQQGEEVELVCRPSPWYAVYPVVAFQTAIAIFASLLLSGFIGFLLMLVPAFRNIDTVLTEGLHYPVWVPILDVLATTPIAAFISYVFAEWNRRRFVFVFLTRTVWVARIKAPFGKPLLSFGPAKLIEEAHAVPAGGERGEGVVRMLDSLFDGILHRFFGIADIHLLTRVIGAVDVMPGIKEAFNRAKVIRELGINAGRQEGGISWVWNEFYRSRVQEQEGTEMPKISPEDLIAAMRVTFPQETERIDLMFLRDPNVWNIYTQQRKGRITRASAGPSAPVEYPTAD